MDDEGAMIPEDDPTAGISDVVQRIASMPEVRG